jgi:hypothetical protein
MKNLKKIAIGLSLIGATCIPVLAQTMEPTTTEWTTYDQWGNKHKTVYTELKTHPDWAYNEGYVTKHPELKAYYDEHPQYWTYVHSHHDWYKHHPGWSKTTTTTTVEGH